MITRLFSIPCKWKIYKNLTMNINSHGLTVCFLISITLVVLCRTSVGPRTVPLYVRQLYSGTIQDKTWVFLGLVECERARNTCPSAGLTYSQVIDKCPNYLFLVRLVKICLLNLQGWLFVGLFQMSVTKSKKNFFSNLAYFDHLIIMNLNLNLKTPKN